ncbi:unnamed protein product [Thelazia callipaeda]|uniref:glutathione gamma-glutamylcysteinyltransferase n=1 Tax=Thelazia callipaeda TaxID=103827 RepID=A0A0N5CSE7_THECL|nr:unnamed protein product [Thelazia callipaeda]
MQGVKQHSITPTRNFYRRKLPPICIDFTSTEGKRLFTESLLKGYANVYFRLASQFLTQDEPAFCGLATLVMALNALEVDPGRVWKSPWRFYHESMLDCCVPLDDIKKSGITLLQFTCLAECNKLCTTLKYAESGEDFLHDLRGTVKRCMAADDIILVVSYNRQVLGQTGAGHFSPLGAYHEDTDQVLIMDVARFKYPPHWVPLTVIRDAMLNIDQTTGKPRGFVTMKLRSNTQSLVLFRFQTNIDVSKTQFVSRLKQWEKFLAEKISNKNESEFKDVCTMFSSIFAGCVACCDCSEPIQSQSSCEEEKKPGSFCSLNVKNAVSCGDICREISNLEIASYITSASLCTLLLAWPLQVIYYR